MTASRTQPLENDRRNPCVGCGPENPVGLRLEFVPIDGGASTILVAGPNYQGWPGRLHSGVLYLAMVETANWAVYAEKGRIGLPVRTGALATSRWVSVGERLRLEARATARTDRDVEVRVEARDAAENTIGSLERSYEMPSRVEFLRRMGYPALPPELDGLVPP